MKAGNHKSCFVRLSYSILRRLWDTSTLCNGGVCAKRPTRTWGRLALSARARVASLARLTFARRRSYFPIGVPFCLRLNDFDLLDEVRLPSLSILSTGHVVVVVWFERGLFISRDGALDTRATAKTQPYPVAFSLDW